MARNDELIFDIGLHKGEDTDFYLKKGYKVVSFEANPALVKICRDRFVAELQSGQLHIVAGAISPPTESGKVTFWVNDRLSVWGTTSIDFVKRNEKKGMPSKEIEVDRIDIAACLREFGMPYFMKVDIEGADGLVLSALRDFEERPQFLSFEINNVVRTEIEEDVEIVASLGYKRFQLAPQADIRGSHIQTQTLRGEAFEHTFAQDASGGFGADLKGEWMDREALLAIFKGKYHGWQDIHAALD